MRAFGAELEIVPSDDGRVTPALFDRFRARVAELTKDPDTYWTDQFNNPDALDGYANIGRELVEQVGHVDAFVGAVGTAGMLIGVSRALKAAGCAAKEEGIFAGTSSGLNLVGALQLARELGPGKVVATVACDTGLKYLAGDLYQEP